MRQGSGLLIALSSLVLAGGCADPLRPPVEGTVPGAVSDAAVADPALPFFCKGATTLAGWRQTAGMPYVTLSDDAGQGCVFVLGDTLADPQTCGAASLTGYTEACSFTAVDFIVWSDSWFATEVGVQGAYAWVGGIGRMDQNGRVLDMVIDSAAPSLTQGHFRVAFDPSSDFVGGTATGTFALCTTPETSVEPCRQPAPLSN